ncbi:hypothetical protein LINPERHAP2_LOCUS31480 [Linum perenne]
MSGCVFYNPGRVKGGRDKSSNSLGERVPESTCATRLSLSTRFDTPRGGGGSTSTLLL